MARKRRTFDIRMPEEADAAPETFPAGKVETPERPARRGPMASAIGETSDAARHRRDAEAAIREENDRLAHELVRLKSLGLLVDLVPLARIGMTKLIRDRAKGADPELAELKESIKTIGLSNPIRVEAQPDGRFELIQGFRRLTAYAELLAETGDAAWAAIPTAISQPGESLEGLYQRMVDENLVRKDISFAEMAQLALDYAADPGTAEADAYKAVALLFRSASYQKRSYIRGFIPLVERLAADLRFATEIPRRLGLDLAARLAEDDGLSALVRADLAELDNPSVRDELEVLRRFAGPGAEGETFPAGKVRAPSAGTVSGGGKAKTSFQFDRREGPAKCTAASGRLEIRLNRDFSTIDRRRLEQAVRRMLDQLD